MATPFGKPMSLTAPANFSLRRFFLKTLLLLPICFGLWYFSAFIWTWPIAWLSDKVLRLLFPQLIAGVEHVGYSLDIVTQLADFAKFSANKSLAVLVFSINPLVYSYSLALYMPR